MIATENIKPGMVLVSRNKTDDPKAWFIFHYGPEGAAAIDLTTPHPDISWRVFEPALKFENSASDKTVLLGGPERFSDALIILHSKDGESPESNDLNEEFSFLAYRLVMLPGHPPSIQSMEKDASEIKLHINVDFIVSLGYRIWLPGVLEEEISKGFWNCLQPSRFDIFEVPHEKRYDRLLKKLN